MKTSLSIIGIIVLIFVVVLLYKKHKAKKKAEEEAKLKAEEEAEQTVEEEAKKKVEEEAKRKAEKEAEQKAEEEAKRKAEEERNRIIKELQKRGVEFDMANHVVPMGEIVSYFRTLGLKQGEDIPFITNTEKKNTFVKQIGNIQFPTVKPNLMMLFVGVYNEKENELKHLKIIEAPDFDITIKDVIKKDGYAILK